MQCFIETKLLYYTIGTNQAKQFYMHLFEKVGLCALWLCLIWFPSVYGQNNNSGKLKAVLVVGHQEHLTQSSIQDMNKIARIFSENDIEVYKFYDKKAVWKDIVKVAKDCSFFIYSGHGSSQGKDGNAGGICITSVVSTKELISSLRLKENALVIFKSVCNGAGSSAGDDTDIGIEEAKKRVSHYAYPFFDVGAVAYYANNYGNLVNKFLEDFLTGISLKQAYLNSAKQWTDIEFEEPFSRDTTKSFSIASSPGGRGTTTRTSYVDGVKKEEIIESIKNYDIAYVGKSDYSIKDMD